MVVVVVVVVVSLRVTLLCGLSFFFLLPGSCVILAGVVVRSFNAAPKPFTLSR